MENQIIVIYNKQQKTITLPLSSSFKTEILSAFDILPSSGDSYQLYYQSANDKKYLEAIEDLKQFTSLNEPLIIEEINSPQLLHLSKPKDTEELFVMLMPMITTLTETLNKHEKRIRKIEAMCDKLLSSTDFNSRVVQEDSKSPSDSTTNSIKIPMFAGITSTKKESYQNKKKLLEEIVKTKAIADYIYFQLEVARKKVLTPKNTSEDENSIKWNQDHIFKYTIELNELKEKASHLISESNDKEEMKFVKQKGLEDVIKRIDYLQNEISNLENDIVHRYNKLKDVNEDKDSRSKYKTFLNSELLNRRAFLTQKEKELLSAF